MKSRESKEKKSWYFNCCKKPQTMDSDLSDQENYTKSLEKLVTEQENIEGRSFFNLLLRFIDNSNILCKEY